MKHIAHHEHFKLFKTPEYELAKDTEIQEFLNSGIIPKSISVAEIDENSDAVMIGYWKPDGRVNQGDGHHWYHIVEETIDDVKFIGISHIGEEVEKRAAAIGGVICQDIQFDGDSVYITFLTTK